MVAVVTGSVLTDRFCDGASQWIFGPASAIGCEAHDLVANAAGNAANDVMGNFAAAIDQAVGTVFQAVTSFWVQLPTPGVTQRSCDAAKALRLAHNHPSLSAGQLTARSCTIGPNDTLAFLWTHLAWFWGMLLVFSVLFAAAKMAWTQRKEPMLDLVRSLVTFLVASTAGVAAVGLAIQAGDQFSEWIINEAAGGDLGSGLLGAGALPQLGAGLVIVLGILGIILGGVQLVLMIFRLAILTLMMTFLPLAASATNTDWGRSWFRRVVGWTVAFLLYKPVAALIYAAAYRLMADGVFGFSGLLSFATGIAMMCLAILALPATMKAVVPAMASMSGSSGGVGAVMAIGATGAAMLATGGTSAAFSGGGAVAANVGRVSMPSTAGASGATSAASASTAAGTAGGGSSTGSGAGQVPGNPSTADTGTGMGGSAGASGWRTAEAAMRVTESVATSVQRSAEITDEQAGGPTGSRCGND